MIADRLAGTTVSPVVLFREKRKIIAFGTEFGSSIGQSLEGIKSAEVTLDSFVDGQILQAKKELTGFHKSVASA